MTETLKKYQLKQAFVNLFMNLSKGQPLTQKDAFAPPPHLPVRKAYVSKEEASGDEAILKRLLDAGFIEEVDTGVQPVLKPGT